MASRAAAEAWRLLVDLVLAQQPRLRETAESLGLAPAQVRALVHLDPDHPLPMRGLADLLHCDASHVTGIVDRLEARGYVERRPDGKDRRVKTLAVTPAGRTARRTALDEIYRPPAGLAALSAADQAALRDLVRKAAGG